jgi:hypothetical protein
LLQLFLMLVCAMVALNTADTVFPVNQAVIKFDCNRNTFLVCGGHESDLGGKLQGLPLPDFSSGRGAQNRTIVLAVAVRLAPVQRRQSAEFARAQTLIA